MTNQPNTSSRREWIKNAGVIFSAMHLPLLGMSAHATNLGKPARLKRLELQAPDLNAMKKFYSEIIGLPVNSASLDSISIQCGETQVVFTQCKAGETPFYHFAFNISENKLGKALAWLQQRTEVLIHKPNKGPIVRFKGWNAEAVYFLDPAGNIVEFIAHHKLNTKAEGEFTINDILYASEIGIVVDDFQETLALLDANLQITPYKDALNDFAAVGTPMGFFIVVKRGRIWLPTENTAAMVHPLTVHLMEAPSASFGIGSLPYTVA